VQPISFRVFGKPRPKGSMKAFCPNARRKRAPCWPCIPIVRDDTPKTLVPWMHAVVAAADRLDIDRPLVGALEIDIVFYMPKPDTKRPYPDGSGGDDDKLERAIKDALQVKASWGGRLIWDDSQFVKTAIEKQWAHPAEPGARITITPLEPQPTHLEDYQRIVRDRYEPRPRRPRRSNPAKEFSF
jgi:Holliday junction resolvase RusA-like endonuclease